MNEIIEKNKILFSFMRSLALCDHMGDVGSACDLVCEIIGVKLPNWDDMTELYNILKEMGVPNLYEVKRDAKNAGK